MRTITGLPGNLGDAARAYIAGFPPGEIVGFPITALDRTGVPVWIVALFLDAAPGLEGAMPSGIGYGATDEDAILGALGEIAEAIAPTLALRGPKIHASYDELVRVHGGCSVADPLTLGLPAGSPVDRTTPLDRGVVIEGAPSPLVDCFAELGIRAIPKFATGDFGLTNLYVVGHDETGYSPPAPISLSACGEACHPDAGAALAKALNEFAAARVRKAFSHGPQALVEAVAPPGYSSRFVEAARAWMVDSESRALTEMLAWSRLDADQLREVLQPIYRQTSSVAFADLPSTPAADPYARGRIARENVAAEGFDILYVDCSPPDRATAAVKVIVPGLEVETMSYHRLGARTARRLIAHDDPLIKFGAATDTLKPVRMPPEQAEALGAPLFDTALADRIVGSLYPLYREPEAHHVAWRMGQAGSERA